MLFKKVETLNEELYNQKVVIFDLKDHLNSVKSNKP